MKYHVHYMEWLHLQIVKFDQTNIRSRRQASRGNPQVLVQRPNKRQPHRPLSLLDLFLIRKPE